MRRGEFNTFRQGITQKGAIRKTRVHLLCEGSAERGREFRLVIKPT